MLRRIHSYLEIGSAVCCASISIFSVTAHAIAQANVLPTKVEASVKQDLVRQFQVPLASLKVRDFSAQAWPDGCLGLAKPEEICTQATVNGWQVTATDGSQNYVYRTDGTGKNLRSETSQQSVLPLAVARKLRQFANRQLGIPTAKISVTAIKLRTFDGCLGIFTPDRACTKIAIPGWQAVLTDGRRSWVYHLDRQASRIVKNSAASNAIAPVAISFAATDKALKSNVLFASSVSGDLSGRTMTNTLTADGKVTRLIFAPNIRSRPVLLRTLTRSQLDRFKSLLARQGLPNLNGLSYLTSASVADVPTVTFQAVMTGDVSRAGTSTSYTSLEQQRVPKSLQTIASAWETIAR